MTWRFWRWRQQEGWQLLWPWVGSGVLLGFGGLSSTFWWLTVFGLGLFVYVACSETRRRSLQLGGATTFALKAAFATSWFWAVYPLDWLTNASPAVQSGLIGVTWLLPIGAGAIAGYVLGWMVYTLRRSVGEHVVWLYVGLPLLWLIAEVFWSFVFSVVTLGWGGSINVKFSFGYVGYVLAEAGPLVYWATWGGVYGLTLVVMGLATVWCAVYVQPTIRRLVLAATTTTLLLLGAQAETSNPTPVGRSVATINTSLSATQLATTSDHATRQRLLEEAVRRAAATEVAHIVLPEDSGLTIMRGGVASTTVWWRDVEGAASTTLIDTGTFQTERGHKLLRTHIYDPRRAEVRMTDKQYLVPVGEFLPFIHQLLARVAFTAEERAAVASQRNYRPGPAQLDADTPRTIPGILFCFAVVDPLSVWRLQHARAPELIVHPVSHAWFNEPYSLWHQLDQMVLVHSVWQEVPIVTAHNMGVTYAGERTKQRVITTDDSRYSITIHEY